MRRKLANIWDWMRGDRLPYAAALGAIVLSAAFHYCTPMVLRTTIDHLIQGRPIGGLPWVAERLAGLVAALGGRSVLAQNLWVAGLAVVFFTGLGSCCTYLVGRFSALASESIARRLRNRLYDHLQRLPCAYHDKAETGDLVQRCTSDVETIRGFLASQVVEVGRAVVLLTLGIFVMLLISSKMTLVAMAFIPPIIAFGVIFFARIGKAFLLSDKAKGKMTAVIQENLSGIRVVREFARGPYEIEKFSVRNDAYRDRWYRLMGVMAWYWSLSDLLCFAQSGLMLVVGAGWVMQGSLSVGDLVAFLAVVGMFIWPVRMMGRILTEAGKAMVSVGRVSEILHQPVETDVVDAKAAEIGCRGLPSPGDGNHGVGDGTVVAAQDAASHGTSAEPVPVFRGRIEIRDLSFSFAGGGPVLRNISLDVPPGGTLALLGSSGSGKSVLVSLILRLYDYKEGSIRIDGHEIAGLPRAAVRSRIGVVLQEPFLYSRTVKDNIRLGDGSAGDVQIESVARAACLHESILKFEKGYDALVGERGVTLSGGQRQRLALARALVKDPPILILDDALSAVDTATETMILKALRERRGRRTTIVIAHRLSTLRDADQIVVLEGGRVIQCGRHEELLQQTGLYRKLWNIQTALEEDLKEELKVAD